MSFPGAMDDVGDVGDVEGALVAGGCCAHAGVARKATWMLAMSAVYGPTDTHPSQGQHPEVLRVKASSLAELQEYLAR